MFQIQNRRGWTLALLLLMPFMLLAQPAASRNLSGGVVTAEGQAVAGATVLIHHPGGDSSTTTNQQGSLTLQVPAGDLELEVSGKYLHSEKRSLRAGDVSQGLRIQVTYSIPPRHETMVITASTLEPSIGRRNGAVYEKSLFSRDDQ